MLVYREGKWLILCNCDNGNLPDATRERFTISHELGHYHIPEHRRQLMAGCKSHGSRAGAFNEDGAPEELEADTFAANLLMAPQRFAPRLRALRQSPLTSIVSLRKEFDTSLESTAIQTMRHDSRVVAIAMWKRDELGWHWISEKSFREVGYRKFMFRRADQLPNDCATTAALAAPETQFDAVIHDGVVTAAFCFGRVASGGSRDVILREEAVRNGKYGVLTVYSSLTAV